MNPTNHVDWRGEEPGTLRSYLPNVAALSLAIFLLGGNFGRWPVSPVVVGALATSFFVGSALYTRLTIPARVLPMLTIFVLAFFPLWWTEFTPYAREKVLLFYTSIFLAGMAPMFLIQTDRDLERLLSYMSAIGLVLAIIGLSNALVNSVAERRLSAFGGNPIWFARACGYAAIWFFFRGLDIARHRLLYSILFVISAVAVISSGSRGPTLFLLASITVVVALHYAKRPDFWRVLGLWLIFLILLAGISVPLFLPWFSATLERFAGLFSAEPDGATRERLDAFEVAFRHIPSNPLGMGYGAFAELSRSKYPHNLFLEVFVELGWLTGAYLMILMALVVHRAFRISSEGGTPQKALLAAVVFSFLNAMVSGDLTSPKDLFLFSSIALSWSGSRRSIRRSSFGRKAG